MGSLGSTGTRRLLLCSLAVAAVAIGALATWSLAAGPGGWDHLGDRGTPGSDSLNFAASALAVSSGVLYVGGDFTGAGGVPHADRIATWNGSSWNAVGSSTERIPDGRVLAIAVDDDDRVFAGGSFHDAGGTRTPTPSRSGTARPGSRSAIRPCRGRRSSGT